jgi:hypothetical protein
MCKQSHDHQPPSPVPSSPPSSPSPSPPPSREQHSASVPLQAPVHSHFQPSPVARESPSRCLPVLAILSTSPALPTRTACSLPASRTARSPPVSCTVHSLPVSRTSTQEPRPASRTPHTSQTQQPVAIVPSTQSQGAWWAGDTPWAIEGILLLFQDRSVLVLNVIAPGLTRHVFADMI